jgi:hypothetical protein
MWGASEATLGGGVDAFEISEEGVEMLFDGNKHTKWLRDTGKRWEAGKTVVWLVLDLPYGRALGLVSYSVTSANDHHERDPSDWRVEGSSSAWGGGADAAGAAENSSGGGKVEGKAEAVWELIDEQKGVEWGERLQKQDFKVGHGKKVGGADRATIEQRRRRYRYRSFRFTFTRLRRMDSERNRSSNSTSSSRFLQFADLSLITCDAI